MTSGFMGQGKRLVRLTTVLGKDLLIAQHIRYTEAMGDGFSIEVQAFSESHHHLGAAELVGTPVTINLITNSNQFRHLHGLVEQLDTEVSCQRNGASQYRITLVAWPQLWLTRRHNYRIFQDASIINVIESILADYGNRARFSINTKKTYKPWRYLVQYDETDYHFICRLMALAGITFYYRHSASDHSLCLIDDPAFITSPAGTTRVNLHPQNHGQTSLTSWQQQARFTRNDHCLVSYNYKNPSTNLKLTHPLPPDLMTSPETTGLTEFRYSEDYNAPDEGAAILRARVSQSSGQARSWTGTGNVDDVAVGGQFSVQRADGTDHPDSGKCFTATAVNLSADNDFGDLRCQISAVELGQLAYPQAQANKTAGLQTAMVVGKPGQELQTDKFNRIKVRFHWDHKRENGHNTCFLRVMQSQASSGFGSQFTPRVGDEVVVAFENGNPHRPFILGSLYNSERPPPYGQQRGLRAGIKTRSSPKGNASNYNELYFHDESGKEEVFLQAERDLNLNIKNNHATKVGNDQTMQVNNNYRHQTGQNMILEAGDQITLQVGTSIVTLTEGKVSISAPEITINGNTVNIN